MIYSHLPFDSSRYSTPEVVGNPRVLAAYGQGLTILVAFSHEMDTHDADTMNPATYALVSVTGVASTVASVSATSNPQVLLLTVDGLTEGGVYTLTVWLAHAMNGQPVIAPDNTATVLGSREPLTLTITPQTGSLLFATTSRNLDPVPTDTGFWAFQSEYPVVPSCLSVEEAGANALLVTVSNQTSVEYTATFGDPAAVSLASMSGTLAYQNGVVSGTGSLTGNPALGVVNNSLAEIQFDLLGAVWTTNPVGTYWSVLWTDGSVQSEIRFGHNGVAETLSWWSDGTQVGSTLVFPWSTATNLRVVRHGALGFVAVVLDGETLWTAGVADLAPIGTSRITLTLAVSVTGFALSQVNGYGSNTVKTLWQNLVYGLTGTFTGLVGLGANATLRTGQGPLVRPDNPLVPARKEDITVLVAGQPVSVASLDPYTGFATLDVPVPAGQTVSVSYWHADRPRFPWKLGSVALGSGMPHPGKLTFGQRVSRFPQQVRLGSVVREQPERVSHRLIGFLKNQSSLLGRMKLGGSPNRHTTNPRNLFPRPQLVSRNGVSDWATLGSPVSSLDSAGVLNLTGAGWYYQSVEETGSTSVQVVSRMSSSQTPARGCWNGVAFGYRGQRWFALVGFLLVDGVRHVGLLSDYALVEQREAWQLGFQMQGTATSQTTLTCETLPVWFGANSRFRVEGNQSGVYTVTARDANTLTFSPALPTSITTFGYRDVAMVLEVDYSRAYSYRLLLNSDTGIGTLLIGGSADVVVSGVVATSESLGIPRNPSVLWGHGLDCTSSWVHTRATVTTFPAGVAFNGNYVELNGTVTPDQESQPWASLGQRGVVSSDGTEVTIKSRGGVPYSRIEPFLTTGMFWDMRLGVQTNQDGGALVMARNGRQAAVLGAILYKESAGTRSLVTLPQVDITGYALPADMGWLPTVSSPYTAWRDGRVLIQSNRGDQPVLWTKPLAWHMGQGTRRMVSRFRSSTPGIQFSLRDGLPNGDQRIWSVRFDHDGTDWVVRLFGSAQLQHVTLDWSGDWHEVELVADGVNGTVLLDGVQILQQAYAANAVVTNSVATETWVGFGTFTRPADETPSVEFEWVIAQALPSGSEKRTLGLWRGGDASLLSSWKLAGAGDTDSTLVSNPVVEMDWRVSLDVRLLYDPSWGVQMQRPDLALPGAGQDATPVLTPGEGYVNLEVLPDQSEVTTWLPSSTLGDITFAVHPGTTESVWRYLHYRLFRDPESVLTRPSLTLGKGQTVTNGIPAQDTTPETVTLTVQSGKLLLAERGIWAQRIYRILDGSTAISSASWSFDRKQQQIAVQTSATELTVVFSPCAPFGIPYLTAQPVEQGSVTGEGTPPFWADKYGPATHVTLTTTDIVNTQVVGTPALDPADPYRVRARQEPLPLAGVTTITRRDGSTGLTAIADDRGGLQAVALQGFQDVLIIPQTYNQSSIFIASGGQFHGGHIGPGTMVCYPVGQTEVGTHQQFATDDTVSVTDQVPPSLDPWQAVNPSGTPVVGGSAYSHTVDWGLTSWLAPGKDAPVLYGSSPTQPTGIPSGDGIVSSLPPVPVSTKRMLP
jgi:hypothetical protein